MSDSNITVRDAILEYFRKDPPITLHYAKLAENLCARFPQGRLGFEPGYVRRVASELAKTGSLENLGNGRFRLCGAASPSPSTVSLRRSGDEDQIKTLLKNHLENKGWKVEVAWGQQSGPDLKATRGGETWLIEVKGSGRPRERLNFFLTALGQLITRISEDTGKYSVAFPDRKEYRSMWKRRVWPLVKERLNLSALFVREDGIEEVGGR